MPAEPRPPAISLFSGAFGLDLGLERGGLDVRAAVECQHNAVATLERNRPGIAIARRIESVPTAELLERAHLRVGEPFAISGGPSCQAFSTAGQRGSLEDPRGTMFREFLRVVSEARPQFFVMENVRGVLSAAVRHRPLNRRGPGCSPLDPDEELGSAFRLIVNELRDTGYYVVFGVVNAADYGVPQTRERVVFLGSRDGRDVRIPAPTHSRDGEDGLPRWRTLRDALAGLHDTQPTYTRLSPFKRRYMERIPEGGNWRDLPTRSQRIALGGAYESWGGRSGFFRRLAWDRPAPALTTRPDSKATMHCHPTETRPLSIREYARVQQFPDDWEFVGSVPQQYVQIGNAVPVGLGEALGRALLAAADTRRKSSRLGTVVCHDADLIDRMSRRPKTVLNPPRMRSDQTLASARSWMHEHGSGRGVDAILTPSATGTLARARSAAAARAR